MNTNNVSVSRELLDRLRHIQRMIDRKFEGDALNAVDTLIEDIEEGAFMNHISAALEDALLDSLNDQRKETAENIIRVVGYAKPSEIADGTTLARVASLVHDAQEQVLLAQPSEQPAKAEQPGDVREMTRAVDAAMVEQRNMNLSPPLRRNHCARLIHAALNAIDALSPSSPAEAVAYRAFCHDCKELVPESEISSETDRSAPDMQDWVTEVWHDVDKGGCGGDVTVMADAVLICTRPPANDEAVAWLSRDEARLAVFQAINAITVGNKTDDKLIVENLRAAGFGIAKQNVNTSEQVATNRNDEAVRLDADRYRWLRDPCSGAEHVIFYGRGDYGRGLKSGSCLDMAIDAFLASQQEEKGA